MGRREWKERSRALLVFYYQVIELNAMVGELPGFTEMMSLEQPQKVPLPSVQGIPTSSWTQRE